MKTIMPKITIALALSLPLVTGLRAQEDPEEDTPPAVKKSLHAAQDKMRGQLDKAKKQLADVHDRLAVVRRAGDKPGQPLVIRSSNIDPKIQANLEEDLAVMSRILDKAAQNEEEDRPRHAMGINVLLGPGANPILSHYLEWYVSH